MSERLPKLNEEQLKEVGEELLPKDTLKESLSKNEKGMAKQTLGNAVKILKEDPFLSGAIQRNELTDRICITRNLGWKRDTEVLNDTETEIGFLLVDWNCNPRTRHTSLSQNPQSKCTVPYASVMTAVVSGNSDNCHP